MKTAEKVRRHDLEEQFREEALRLAGQGDMEDFRRYAERRMDEGADEYGDTQFYHGPRPCHREGSEEFVDGANWLALQFVVDTVEGDITGSENLLAAAAHAALSYDFVKRYREARR